MIVVAADHAAVELKAEIVRLLDERGVTHEDLGPFETASVDYPDFAHRVADEIVSGRADRGILICGTGIGMSITANKVKGIRAALCFSKKVAKLSRTHNDANILVLSGRNKDTDDPISILDIWLETKFSNAKRHLRRIKKIKEYEDKHST